MNKTAFFAAMLLGLGWGAARAVSVTSGTAEAVTFRHCIPGLTACDDISAPVFTSYGGSPGAATSSTSATVADIGSGSGSVALSGVIGAPILGGHANSLPSGRVSTNSVALQSYTYTGLAADTRAFDATLTYSQDLTGSYPDEASTGIFASIWVFMLSVPAVDVGTTPESNFHALFFFDFPGFTLLGSQSFADRSSTAAGSVTFGVTVPLTPGQTVWVDVQLQTPAVNGSSVDATHTLMTAWDNPLDLAPAAAVPEPATDALICLGLVGIAWCQRRQARNLAASGRANEKALLAS